MARKRSERRPKQNPGATYVATPARQRFIEKKVDDTLKELKLTLSRVRSSLTGTRVLSANSFKSYEGTYRQLRYFFSLIGDWESMLILLEDAPAFVPSMNVDSLIVFLDWKTLPRGTVLKRGGRPIRIAGTARGILKADGGWANPGNTIPFNGAISAVHVSRGMKGQAYEEGCRECIHIYEADGQNNVSGCRFHAGRPRLWRQGNTRFAVKYCDRVKQLFKVDLKEYQPMGDSMLTPRELLNIRQYCLAKNDLKHWRLWTMMLMSVKLFLRSDEVYDFDEVNFVLALTSLDEDESVGSMVVTVQGKRDVVKAILSIFRDDDVPELCLIRQLLAWLWVSNWTSGPLFPAQQGSGVPIRKSTYAALAKKVTQQVTGRAGPFGTHFCRKTGWLLGSWGGAEDTDLSLASRHKSIKQAAVCKQDAMTLYEYARASGYNDSYGCYFIIYVWFA